MDESNECLYCTDSAGRNALMLPVMRLDVSALYLMRDQLYPGRCIVAFEEHKRELFDLGSVKLYAFMGDVARTAEAVQQLFEADKINYAIYGDRVSHLHMHIVPKRRDGAEWGGPFVNSNPNPRLLSGAGYAEVIGKLNDRLSRRNTRSLGVQNL